MSTLIPGLSGIEQFSGIFDSSDLLESRFENNGDNNPIYVGYSVIANADPAANVWYIQQIVYDGVAIVRKRLPNAGIGFKYSWNDRASFFP